MDFLWHRRGAVVALIFFCGLVAFHNSFENSFHFDDEHSILENYHLRSLRNIPRFFVDPGMFSALPDGRMYRPLLLVTYALNYAVGEYEVWGYHVVNLLLHLLNAWLVWKVGGVLLGDRNAALFAALIFAVHPLITEPVNYISSRSSLLAAAFYLPAFWFLLRPGRKTGVWIGLLYLGALASKSIAFTFPLIGAVYLLLVGRRQRWLLLLAPAVLGGLYLLLTRAIVGKALLEPVRSHSIQVATQIKALAYYLWTVAMPVHLSVEPQFVEAKSLGDSAVVLAGLLVVSLGLVGVWGRRQSRHLVFALAWFFLTLLPTVLVPLYVLVNEHRLYLPLVGVAWALAALVWGGGRPVRRVGGLILLVFVAQSVQRNQAWESEETLWADAVAKGPLMARPHANLGKACLEQDRLEEAIAHSRRALELDPYLEVAHHNIGMAYMRSGQLDVAVAHYRRALELQPGLYQAHNNLGNTYQEQGRFREAIQAYRKALEIQLQAEVLHNMGKAFLDSGQPDSARVAFRQALSLDPGLQEAYKGLVKTCRVQERLQTALEVLQEARQRWPEEIAFWVLTGDVHASLGQDSQAARAYRRAGKDEKTIALRLGREASLRQEWRVAREHFERALQEEPEDARIHNALGEAWYGQGRIPEALEAFRRAARLDPELTIAYVNIGRVYLDHGGALEAIAALERAVELEPEEGVFQAVLADAYSRANRPEQAIKAYQEAIRLAPGKAELYHNLGLLYQGAGYGPQAEKMYREAIERDPRLAGALFNLGNLRLDQKQFEAAAALYQRALEVEPDHAEALINLAMARLNLGQRREAMAAYGRFLEVYEGEDEGLRDRVRRQLEALRQQEEQGAPQE